MKKSNSDCKYITRGDEVVFNIDEYEFKGKALFNIHKSKEVFVLCNEFPDNLTIVKYSQIKLK